MELSLCFYTINDLLHWVLSASTLSKPNSHFSIKFLTSFDALYVKVSDFLIFSFTEHAFRSLDLQHFNVPYR